MTPKQKRNNHWLNAVAVIVVGFLVLQWISTLF